MHKPSGQLAAKLRTGNVCFSLKLNLVDPRAAEIGALCGADALWLDQEHCASDWSDIYHQILACGRHGADAIVRVSKGSYSDLVKPLELGAAAVMVPQVSGPGEAHEIVRQTKFHPLGRRALDGGNADGGYGLFPFGEYLSRSNDDNLTIVQLESPTSIRQADEIAAVDGIDVLFFGPGDYCQAAGIPGQYEHPAVEEAQQQMVDACLKSGKIAGTVLHPGTTLENLVLQGYRLINLGADVLSLGTAFSQAIQNANQTVTNLQLVRP